MRGSSTTGVLSRLFPLSIRSPLKRGGRSRISSRITRVNCVLPVSRFPVPYTGCSVSPSFLTVDPGVDRRKFRISEKDRWNDAGFKYLPWSSNTPDEPRLRCFGGQMRDSSKRQSLIPRWFRCSWDVDDLRRNDVVPRFSSRHKRDPSPEIQGSVRTCLDVFTK